MRTAAQLREQIIEKAILDSGFRSRLVEDPTGTVTKELGVTLPDGFQLKVLEDDGVSTSHIVLPPPSEITEEELSQISAASQCDGSQHYLYDC